MERTEFRYFKAIGDEPAARSSKIVGNVNDFFVGKDPVIIKDSYRLYAYTFTGMVMDGFYTYPKLIQNLIKEYNLIGLKVEFEIVSHYTIICIETVTFTIYASKKVMTLVQLNPQFFEEEYLSKFNSVL